MLFLGNQDLDGCSALLFAISSESQCAPVWFSLTERPTRDEYICSMCSCDRTIRQMEMLNGIARNHWNETVNKYYNLAKALFQRLSVASEASCLCWGQFSKYFGNEEEGRKAGRGIWYLTEICLEICEMQRWWDLWGHRCGGCGSSDN